MDWVSEIPSGFVAGSLAPGRRRRFAHCLSYFANVVHWACICDILPRFEVERRNQLITVIHPDLYKLPILGEVFTFKLPDGMWFACRVQS